jgi:4'-phosphopantetheinyl transferase
MSNVDYRAAEAVDRRFPGASECQRNMLPTTGTVMPIAGGTVEVVSVRLNSERSAAGELAQCLSNDERFRARRFVSERDRCRFIVGRARLRQLLASRLGIQPDAVEFVYGRHGKPALSRRFAGSELHFNVAHSEDVAVYAFSREGEIGVDVEAVRGMEDADKIAERFFSRNEYVEYRALYPRERALGFFNCWTRKEAFVKAIGDGLHYPLRSFDVSLTPGVRAKILRTEDTPGDDCGWRLGSFSPAPGFIGAVAARNVGDRAG